MTSTSTEMIDFANEFIPIDETQIRMTEDGKRASVIDVIVWVTGYNSQHAAKTFTRMSKVVDREWTNCEHIRIRGKGKPTPVADAPTMVDIIWELPGKMAKQFRRRSALDICRILGGDTTLADEINRRAQTVSSAQKRFFLGSQPDQRTETPEEYRLRLDEQRARINQMHVSTVSKAIELGNKYFPDDIRVKLALKDMLVNLNGGESSNSQHEICPDISDVLRTNNIRVPKPRNLKLTMQCFIGRKLKKHFKKQNPEQKLEKTERSFYGKLMKVNTYPVWWREEYQTLVVELAREYMKLN